MRYLLIAVMVASVIFAPVSVAAAATQSPTVYSAPAFQAAPTKARVFKNCKAMNRVYPHGVARTKKAKDKTSGEPVTNFVVRKKVYNANRARDRDGDQIACEKH